MSLFKALRKADEEKDIEAYRSLHHEDFAFVRHQTDSTMNKTELRVLVLGMMTHPSFQELMTRCIYENDDILVTHLVMRFQDGSRESVLIVKMIENGQVIRSESGATPMK